MANNDRMALFPSRANFVAMKQRVAGAQKGLALLRRKRDALELQLRSLRRELKMSVRDMPTLMHEAIFSMAKASFLNTDFNLAFALKPQRADAYLHVQQSKILGFTIPKFILIMNSPTSLPYTGLSTGGRQVEQARNRFQYALQNLVTIASLHYSESILQDAVRQNNMRVNGLDFVLIPRFTNTLNYIIEALDEREREDFYRLKCSQSKQVQKKSVSKELCAQSSTTALLKSYQSNHSEIERPSQGTTFTIGSIPSFMKQSRIESPGISSIYTDSINIHESDIKPKKVIESTSDLYESSDTDKDEQ